MKRKALLLVNLGTPESPSPKDVGIYLKQFLNDPRVIDIPQPWRWILVNLAIIPIRKYKSAKLYKSIWKDGSSPLLFNMEKLTEKLRLKWNEGNNEDIQIEFAMRYGKPSIEEKMIALSKNAYEILIFPLYPQYASSTTASTIDEVFRVLKSMQAQPCVRILPFFFYQNFYLKAKSELIKKYSPDSYDAVVFSYHGLPKRQIIKCSNEKEYSCFTENCCTHWSNQNYYCYKAQCVQTTKLLVEKCGLDSSKCLTTFQSRLSNNWLEPFTDKVLLDLLKKGKKSVLIISPAFVSDCLETIHELGEEYRKLFMENGGEKYEWVRSLNADDYWIQKLSEFLKSIMFSEKIKSRSH